MLFKERRGCEPARASISVKRWLKTERLRHRTGWEEEADNLMSLIKPSDYLVSQVEDVRVELLLVVPSDPCYRYTTSS